jgi:hypothetical protein
MTNGKRANDMGFLAALSAKTWAGIGIAVAFAAFLGWGALALVDSTRAACEREHELDALHAAEEAHQVYLAEVARGNALSAELAKTQRRLANVEREYLAYAHGIAGNCPADLGVLVGAAASGAELPATAGASADPAATVAAAAIAANIATNYPRCHAAIAQLDALIDFHAGSKKDLTNE